MAKFLAGFNHPLTTLAGIAAGVGYALEAVGIPAGHEVMVASIAFMGYAAKDAQKEENNGK